MLNLTPVIQALRQRFVAEWGNLTPVTYDLQPDAPLPKGIYCHFRVTRGTVDHAFGNRWTGEAEQIGRVWLQVFVPKDQGDLDAQELLDRFGEIFAHWSSDTPDIECQLPDTGPEGEVNGRHMYSVSVPYLSRLPY